MTAFLPGQRWLSETQTELGLGLVTACEGRRVSILFPATGETRIYAQDNAPLSRVRFQPGERVRVPGGEDLLVTAIEEREGIYFYRCEDAAGQPSRLAETRLDPQLPLNRPRQRLLAGRFDRDVWFELRYETWRRGVAAAASPVLGLVGPRISPIPHQLFIATEVAGRMASRVLLADEVGLGKTIEAGLILHRLLAAGRVARALILVPEPLLHQWLVEMRRRFNLRFALFDRERLADIRDLAASPVPVQPPSPQPSPTRGEGVSESAPCATKAPIVREGSEQIPSPNRHPKKNQAQADAPPGPVGGLGTNGPKTGSPFTSSRSADNDDNPFLIEPLTLCPLACLLAAPAAARALLAADWDLLIVDEAHHLRWSETATSPEYDLVAALAARTPGVLLLTATPEQLGRAGHFGRLRLLDPHRWHDYAAFLAEEADYLPIAGLAGRLLDGQGLTAEDRARLQHLGLDPEQPAAALVSALIDRHGTSRVLFRNTRAAIHGFPARLPVPHPLPRATLPAPSAPAETISGKGAGAGTGTGTGTDRSLNQTTRSTDDGRATLGEPLAPARIAWMAGLIRQLRPEKLVVICAQAEIAMGLRRALLEREGLHAALFHEGMDIVERDRAAAFFADAEDGAQALICSEIGGEGRNFQFAHHLVLFDLPLDPEVLEQRIGRLDRIGQTETIRIHIPYQEGGPEELLYRWYQEGLDAFAAICPAAGAVNDLLGARLRALLEATHTDHHAFSDALIAEARRVRERLNAELAAGRDRLLELHSYRPGDSSALATAILDQDADPALRDYLTRVWDSFGIDIEPGSGATLIIKPGVHRLHEHFPELPEEGLTVTFDRGLALAREDREFLTWEHPMTRGAMAMILDSDLGSCALTILRDPELPTGSLLLEMIHVAQCPAPPALEIGRFLPPTALRLVLDAQGRDRADDFPPERLRGQCLTRNRKLAQAILQAKATTLETMLDQGERLAAAAARDLEGQARARMRKEMTEEIERLRALARVNPNVRPAEIAALEDGRDRLAQHLGRVRLHLDALRLVVAA